MKSYKKLIIAIVLAAVLIFLINPQWIPFMPDGTANEVRAQIQESFGGLLGGSGGLTPGKIVSAAAAAIVVCLLVFAVCAILDAAAKRKNSARSVAGLFSSLTKFVGAIVGVVWVLGILGVDLAGIFASLGIASLIIGFGAQSLIEDAVTGIFIIFEGQYQVGDIIVLDEFRGVVRHIGIRTTTIEDDGGNLKVVNNSDIRNLQNRSRAASVAVSDLGISYDASIEEVEKIIAKELPGIYERHKDVFLSAPRYVGVQALADSAVVLRFVVDVTEEKFFAGFRALNRELKLMCDKHGIEIPYNQLVVHQAEK